MKPKIRAYSKEYGVYIDSIFVKMLNENISSRKKSESEIIYLKHKTNDVQSVQRVLEKYGLFAEIEDIHPIGIDLDGYFSQARIDYYVKFPRWKSLN